MKKRILSVLLSIAMVVTMLPIINTTVHAADPNYTFDIVRKYHYPQNGSNPETIPLSAFQEGLGDWHSNYTSPETKDFIAMFLVFKVDVSIPAYTKVKVNCQPKAEASSVNFNLSGNFGLELFCFDNNDEWKNLVFKTGTGDDRSSGASLAKSTANTFTATEIALDSSQHYKEFDNSNGEATTGSFYYGILGYYRETGAKHQLSLGWDFESISPYVDAKYIHYDANGGSGYADSVTTERSSTVTLHNGEGFTKNNSAFVGWYDGSTSYAPGSAYTKEEGAKLRAQYLTYDLSDCDGTVTPDIREGNGFAIASADNIYKVGHTFQNWNTQQNGGGTAYAPGDVYFANKGITLYPYFEPNKYDVTILSDNCTTTLNQNPATYGTKVKITAEPDIGYQVDSIEVYKTADPTVTVSFAETNTFNQPEYPVTVKVNCSKIPYAIDKYPTANGSFTVSDDMAGINDVVTITPIPDEGFELDTITVSRTDTAELLTVTDNKFTMVPAPVKVAVTFKNSIYNITKLPTTNGSFTIDRESTIFGDTVVVNAVPDVGYRVKSITAYKTGDETATIKVTGSSFVMPAFPVTVEVEFELTPYEIFKSAYISSGNLTISHTEAYIGDTVSIETTAANGYILDAITVYKTDDESVTVEVAGGSFIMPGFAVTVHATFKKIDCTISVTDASNEKGSFTVDKTTAQIGDTVTVDIICAEGWAIRGIMVTDSQGVTTFVDKTFTMPASDVTVSVSYMVIPTYVITIPATVELGGAPMTVSITNAVMEEGVSLKVYLETDFTARTDEGAEKTFAINAGSIQSGDVVLMVEGGGTPENPKQGSARLALEWDETYQYSGNYRASLAFTIKVEDAGYDQTE